MKKYVNSKTVGFLTIILFFSLIYFFIDTFGFFKTKAVEASSEDFSEIKVLKNENPIDINKVLNENTKDEIKEEMIFEEIDLEYTTTYINNDKLPSGTIHVTQLGKEGKQDVITIKTYSNNKLVSEKIVASNLKRAAINKTVEIGTGRGKNSYEVKDGDISYSTAASLQLWQEASEESKKLITVPEGTKVEVIKAFDTGWSYVYINDREGYVLSEALSNINPIEIDNLQNNVNELSKEELMSRLSYSMNVAEPSGLSLEQFRQVLQYNKSDKNNIFTDNCDYFYYAEQEYGINGIFLAAIAIHESGWGTSKIAQEKNNLFGYRAYDDSAYSSAKQFGNYAEGIDLLARVLIKYYLYPNGTAVYSGNVAEGKYYLRKYNTRC